MYKCIIVDDEEPARLLLNDYCEKIENLEVVGIFKSPLQCIETLEKEPIDILLLDINMPDISGIDFLKSLTVKPKVILTTAYRDYAVEGFELEVSDYLLKPIEFHRFLKAINKVKSTFTEQPLVVNTTEIIGSIQVKANKRLYKINYDDILFIQSQSEYVMYHTESHGKLMVYGTIKSVEKMLPNTLFYRIHRSYIVNKDYIKFVEGNQIVLENEKLPLGDNYKKDFMTNW